MSFLNSEYIYNRRHVLGWARWRPIILNTARMRMVARRTPHLNRASGLDATRWCTNASSLLRRSDTTSGRMCSVFLSLKSFTTKHLRLTEKPRMGRKLHYILKVWDWKSLVFWCNTKRKYIKSKTLKTANTVLLEDRTCWAALFIHLVTIDVFRQHNFAGQ